MLGRQTLTAHYWTEALEIKPADIEALFGIMLEGEKPLDSHTMVRWFVQRRVRQEDDVWKKHLKQGELFQPRNVYEAGQKLVFPALDFALGEVVGTRAGSNPDQGEFTVLEVEFDDGIRREFASDLQAQHKLNLEADEDGAIDPQQVMAPVDVDDILRRYGSVIEDALIARLEDEQDVVYAAGLWFLQSLLPTIDEGHVNLAEAVLDMNGGGPLAAEDILPILDLPAEINITLQAFALNDGMYHDRRFDEIGPAGLVRWYLRRLEPDAVQNPPERLIYDSIPYEQSLLTEEDRELIVEIGDEFSPLSTTSDAVDEVSLTLIYPHRLTGTLPLNASLSAMFPTAYEAERILVTLVDSETGDEHQGWVVREGRYVYGLERFYRKHKLPIGAFVRIKATDDPGRFLLEFDGYRPRVEWITLVTPQDGRMSFQSSQRSIGAAYDELMVLGADDLEKVEALWKATRAQKRSLLQIIREIMPELARLNPQNAVHVKTLYSAVNVIRRCPPGPILAALESQPAFEPVGGHYWRFNRDA